MHNMNETNRTTKKLKFILDACCGPRMMWYDKHHPNTIYIDKRQDLKGFSKYKPTLEIKPDIIMDFRHLEFEDNSFKLVVMDPPHLIHAGNGIMRQTFGGLNADTWNDDIRSGLKECMRVLEPYGVLIFKWNDHDIKLKDLEKIFPFTPLFYNISNGKITEKCSNTAWFCFMKIPNEVKP